MSETAAFYTVTTADYFTGLVALLNSLRLTGHQQELVVLDDGLTPAQRERLEPYVTLVELPGFEPALPALKKTFPDLLSRTGVVAQIDTDMIVTSSVEPQLAEAASGRIVLFPDHESNHDRWFAEWEELFRLAGPPRRQTYLNTGFVAFSIERWPDLLPRWREACATIPPERVAVAPGLLPRSTVMSREPFWAADQDALNAILMAELPENAVAVQAVGAEPDWLSEVEVVDRSTLECRYRGGEAAILHFSLAPKPWQRNGWRRATRNAYLELLPRVLLEDDVVLRLEPRELPRWLRGDARASVTLTALDGAWRGRDSLVRTTRAGVQRLPSSVRAPLLGLRDRIAARRLP
jgi:hypothetical protein